ncbi:response regulator of zinc sigma-54-dependent two-component system [Desulfocucumis palustris]|uniref:Response regulator of zinc sigma-54-dependent two-component system n=2 Tax=Desulfocucumis palustris TaxID=1898651 RepID=A0A2L2XCC3_9FIRM|nr:response regulator of zinc sigma-54-dependent two-component system [Desulfocucumis palustris]
MISSNIFIIIMLAKRPSGKVLTFRGLLFLTLEISKTGGVVLMLLHKADKYKTRQFTGPYYPFPFLFINQDQGLYLKSPMLQSFSQQVAEVVSAVLGVDTGILAADLTIVAGSGKYLSLIGTKDSEVNYPDSSFLYTRVIKTKSSFIVENPVDEDYYSPVYMGELGEICCPITMGNIVIGIIALVAFNETQRARLLEKKEHLQSFLQHIAAMLASRVAENNAFMQLELAKNQLQALVESIHEGLLAIDHNNMITYCNAAAAKLLGRPKEEITGKRINYILPDSPLPEIMETGEGYRNKEEFHGEPPRRMHFLVTATPITLNSRPVGVVATLRDMTEARRLAYNLTGLQQKLGFDQIKGTGGKITEVKNKAFRVAQGSSTILITGESGTGKELFARAIHEASPRRNKPFVIVNCGAIPETLLESELFGYDEGSFTGARKGGRAGKFELADGGTVFLDEIGDLPLHLQVKLLHVLQRREIERVGSSKLIPVNVRVISATNRDLEAMCAANEFREDLYYRLSVIPLVIPPLREHREDINMLMNYFLDKYKNLLDKAIKRFDKDVAAAFCRYDWPGNVRELENAVEYAVNLASADEITMDGIPLKIRDNWLNPESKKGNTILKNRLNLAEKEVLTGYVKKIKAGNIKKGELAEILGISRVTLYRKLKQYGLDK